ncbi:F-box protein At3g07870-like [Chenopodium quinoa]|uniref:F-box domain-containing protein n=1 Tax=Chenopodium quinoa TaxID=63459 RepID=A0A803LEF6_CHEQI|nr:F-box protein At3g07870-like [Chenopodium quinoa]
MSILVTLPEDVISEILLRLPVKSLQRFKCVSKSWNARIIDPRFMLKRFISSNNHELLLISHVKPAKRQLLSLISSETLDIKNKHFQLSFPSSNEENRSFAHILGPCNGIFCVFDAKDGAISLWNPANRQLKNLPKSHVKPPLDAYTFDLCVGFGFDDERNEYKVLAFKHMCLPSSSTIAHAELYTLSTNKWKEVDVGEEFQPTGNLPCSSSNPSVDGISSWFEIDNHVEKVIFSFNMKNEVFTKTQLPQYNGIPSKRVHGCLASLKNSLAFIHDFPLGGVSKSFDVWVLGEYGVRKSWMKQLTIGPVLGVAAPLGFWKNGELLLEHAERNLVSYNPVTQDMKDLQARGFVYILQVLPYKESLVCLQEAEEEINHNRDVIPFSVFECEEENILQIPSSSNSLNSENNSSAV